MENNYDNYEPSKEELEEIEQLLNKEEELEEEREYIKSNRIFHEFVNRPDFIQWLKQNGIRW